VVTRVCCKISGNCHPPRRPHPHPPGSEVQSGGVRGTSLCSGLGESPPEALRWRTGRNRALASTLLPNRSRTASPGNHVSRNGGPVRGVVLLPVAVCPRSANEFAGRGCCLNRPSTESSRRYRLIPRPGIAPPPRQNSGVISSSVWFSAT